MAHKSSTTSEIKCVRQTVYNKLSSREFWALHDKPLNSLWHRICVWTRLSFYTTLLLLNYILD